jgi:hypothetical protein
VDQGSARTVCGGRRILGPIFFNFDITLSYSTSAEVCLHIVVIGTDCTLATVRDWYRLHVSGRT